MKTLLRLAALLAVTALAVPGIAVAAPRRYYVPRPHVGCRAGYVRKTVKVHERRHDKRVVIRQVRCVAKTKPTTTTKPTASLPIAGQPTIRYSTGVDPSFLQGPSPLHVVYTFSASAAATVNGVTTDLATVGQLPAGLLNLYSATSPGQTAQQLICSVNVGGAITSSTCSMTYPAIGSYQITTQYVPNGATATTATDTETILPFATTTTVAAQPNGSATNYIATVADQNGTALSPDPPSIGWVVTDTTSGQPVATFSNVGGVGTFQERVQYDFTTHQPVGTAICIEQAGWCGDLINTSDTFSVQAIYSPVADAAYTGSSSKPMALVLSP